LILATTLSGDVTMRHRPALAEPGAQSTGGQTEKFRPVAASRNKTGKLYLSLIFLPTIALGTPALAQTASLIGKEISVPLHLQDGQELETSIRNWSRLAKSCFRRDGRRRKGKGAPSLRERATRSPIRPHRWCSRETSTGSRDPIRTLARAVTTAPSTCLGRCNRRQTTGNVQ
jgi:hypothetical protein